MSILQEYSSNFISSSSIVSFENLLNLFTVAFTSYYQIIFIKIMIIFKSNSLKIFSFIEFLKMTTSIFFSIAMFFAVRYMIFMSISKFSETLHFDEYNIIEFLKRFKKLCDEYEIIMKK